MENTLEQVLAQVAEQNILTVVSVGRMPVGDRVVHTACVHWDGYSSDGISCAHGHSNVSIADALNNAIAKAQVGRILPTAVVSEVPAFEVAA
jgi:hypothetical protein